jgi:cell division protein FtsB
MATEEELKILSERMKTARKRAFRVSLITTISSIVTAAIIVFLAWRGIQLRTASSNLREEVNKVSASSQAELNRTAAELAELERQLPELSVENAQQEIGRIRESIQISQEQLSRLGEAEEIRFERGSTEGIVSGKLSPGEVRTFKLWCFEGQEFEVELLEGNDGVEFVVFDVEEQEQIGTSIDDATKAIKISSLPYTGYYSVGITSREESVFKLRFQISTK